MEYSPSLEFDPRTFLLVIGPQFTATVLSEIGVDSSIFALTNRRLVNLGIEVLLQTGEFQSDAERVKCLYSNAYELDPLFAVKKLSSSLQKNGKYKEWLTKAFKFDIIPLNKSPSLQKIKHFQQEGALVLYMHFDDILSRLSKTQPVLMNDASSVEMWCNGESNGILYLHGVYSDHETVVLDTDTYHTNHPLKATLSKVLYKRHILMLGFDTEKNDDDHLLTKFTEQYMHGLHENLHSIHLTKAREPFQSICVQKVSCVKAPSSCLHTLSGTSVDVCECLKFLFISFVALYTCSFESIKVTNLVRDLILIWN